MAPFLLFGAHAGTSSHAQAPAPAAFEHANEHASFLTFLKDGKFPPSWGHGTTTQATLRITSIDAPAALSVGDEGTWTVNAKSTATSSLSYSVKWGDEGAQTMRAMSLSQAIQSSATFTHTYATAGSYTPEFTVTDSNGKTVSKAAASVTVSAEGVAHLTSLSETSGYAGDSVTITGSGFTASSTVYVGGTVATTSTVNSDTSITFTVPSMGVGSYDVYVTNENGSSNAIRFELKAAAPARVSIEGVNAPVRLSVNQEGTWTVHTGTSALGSLRYSVIWGDEPPMRISAVSVNTNTQTSATFTHSYSTAGKYAPKFTVSDDQGHSSSVSATVVVTQ